MSEIIQECILCGKIMSEYENIVYDGICKECATHEKEVTIST